MRILHLICFLFIAAINLQANDALSLELAIKKEFPSAIISKKEAKYHYQEQWIIMIDQWLDHEDHNKGKFRQQVILSHFDTKAPMLIVTEGYDARSRHYELSEMLMSNQLIVEYRFFGKSKPALIDYQYLTNEQAMKDLHRIRKGFGKIYKKEWVSTGISKGGTTCLYYKATFPGDVKVAVPYVAPLPKAREDMRTNRAIEQAGTETCREKLYAFQRSALQHQDAIKPLALAYANESELTFNRVDGIEKAIEYAVLEYTFSFWQMGHDCSNVPITDDAVKLWEHLKEIVGVDFYSDAVIDYYEPSFYQFMTQNGYYSFTHKHLDDLLKHVKVYDNAIFAPRGVSLEYDPLYNQWINKRLDKKGKHILLIQGEYDPWGALTYHPKKKCSELIVHPGGSHLVRIKDLSEENKRKVHALLNKWLRTEVKTL